MKAETLAVPGATLYYEVRGSGPVLLMIPGGPMDAGGFAAVAERMADQYTVVTYDCRGNSRSTAAGPWTDLTVQVMADDAQRLLAAFGSEPACVLGSSGGATYGLDLVARYPGRVGTLVAYEPPVSQLLPDAAHWRAFNEEISATYRRDGAVPALQKFTQGLGFGNEPAASDAEPRPDAAETARRTQGNLELFAGHLIPAIGSYSPDIAALRSSSTRIVVGVGDASTPSQMPYRAAHALAAALGVPAAQFPGGHGGVQSHPDGFATRLREALA